jgi:hypothetical protein
MLFIPTIDCCDAGHRGWNGLQLLERYLCWNGCSCDGSLILISWSWPLSRDIRSHGFFYINRGPKAGRRLHTALEKSIAHVVPGSVPMVMCGSDYVKALLFPLRAVSIDGSNN